MNSAKNVSATTEPDSENFDFEKFKESLADFFDCTTSSVWKSSVNGDFEKCTHCKKRSVDLKKKCNQCKAVSYCDRVCQKKDWKEHKKICRNLRQNEDVLTADSGNKEQEKKSHFDEKGDAKLKEKVLGSHFDEKGDAKLKEKQACFNCNRRKDDLKKCIRCNIAAYCDKQCQISHWPEHKGQCDGPPAPSIPSIKFCLHCKKKTLSHVKCSKCNIAVYCDERCRTNHRLEHKVACGNLPNFHKALEQMSETLGDFRGIHSTEIVLPPLPHPFLGQFVRREGVSLMLEIVEPHFNPFRHTVIVQDVNSERVPMFFYHEKHEEIELLPKTLGGMLTPGNFLRWFYPRWHFFLDGQVGFRIDSLAEMEFLQRSTRFEFSPM